MTAESGRRASRLELMRARLHESGRRSAAAREGDVTTRATLTQARPAADRDARPSPITGPDTATVRNGIRPAPPRPADPDRRACRIDGKPGRKFQSGNVNQDRPVPVASHAEIRGRLKFDASVDRQEYAQVRKPPPTSSLPADRGGQTGAAESECRPLPTPGHDDSTNPGRRRLAQKTSSSSSLLSKSQNFFARLRSRKNDPTKTTKSASRDGGSGNGSNRKIRRSISESGCAMYANRECADDNVNSVDTPPNSAHLDSVTSTHVTAEQRTVGPVGRLETVGGDAVADSTYDYVTTADVHAKVEPSTSPTSTDTNVVLPAESASGSGQAGSTAVYEECAGSYSLREALLQRGGDTEATEASSSTTSSYVVCEEPAPDLEANRVHPQLAQTSSLLPVSGLASGCGRSMMSWRRRKLLTSQSTGSMVGGRREGRLERIQEVDSPPGSADDDQMPLQSPHATSSSFAEQRVDSDKTTQQWNCKFIV